MNQNFKLTDTKGNINFYKTKHNLLDFLKYNNKERLPLSESGEVRIYSNNLRMENIPDILNQFKLDVKDQKRRIKGLRKVNRKYSMFDLIEDKIPKNVENLGGGWHTNHYSMIVDSYNENFSLIAPIKNISDSWIVIPKNLASGENKRMNSYIGLKKLCTAFYEDKLCYDQLKKAIMKENNSVTDEVKEFLNGVYFQKTFGMTENQFPQEFVKQCNDYVGSHIIPWLESRINIHDYLVKESEK